MGDILKRWVLFCCAIHQAESRCKAWGSVEKTEHPIQPCFLSTTCFQSQHYLGMQHRKGNTCWKREDRNWRFCSFPAQILPGLCSHCKVYDYKPGAGKLTIQIELPDRFSWTQFYSTFVLEQQEWSCNPDRMTYRALGTCSLALYKKFGNPHLKCEFIYFFYVAACLIASEL